jgi:hypothetical protein
MMLRAWYMCDEYRLLSEMIYTYASAPVVCTAEAIVPPPTTCLQRSRMMSLATLATLVTNSIRLPLFRSVLQRAPTKVSMRMVKSIQSHISGQHCMVEQREAI